MTVFEKKDEPQKEPGLTQAVLDEFIASMDKETAVLNQINNSPGRTNYSMSLQFHEAEAQKLALGLRERMVLIEYYRNRLNPKE